MRYRVYLAASTQDKNIGVMQYGTEQDRMQFLADRIGYWLKTQKKFTVFRNKPGWSLKQTVDDCNNLACDLFIDNHSNAGPPTADGAEIYYASTRGKIAAEAVYKKLEEITPAVDNGVRPDTFLYTNGLYVLRNTLPVAILVEHFYHSNFKDVEHYLKNIDLYAKETAKGICEYFEVTWYEPTVCPICVDNILQKLEELNISNSTDYWKNVLQGAVQADPQYLQILLSRLLNLI